MKKFFRYKIMKFLIETISIFLLFAIFTRLICTENDNEDELISIDEENNASYCESKKIKTDEIQEKNKNSSNDAKTLFPHLFNITYIKENTQNYEHLRVALKETPDKGIGIFANKAIKADRVLLYYQMKVFESEYYEPVSNGMYFFNIVDKYEDIVSDELTGDIYEGSNRRPKGRIPFWGYLANEPSGDQTDNAEADYNVEENYGDKEYLTPGDIVVYKIWSTRDIEPGEEITWCYGAGYKRYYKSNCFYDLSSREEN